MKNNTYELQVVDRVSGEVNEMLTEMYNDYLLYEDVEGMNLPFGYKIELNENKYTKYRKT